MNAPSNLIIEGRLVEASNGTYLCRDQETHERFVYKPVSGERPLWDFPEGTLTFREIAAFNVNRLLGWNLVPNTTWLDEGPLGAGMVQEWIDVASESGPVELYGAEDVPEEWIPILSAQDAQGNPVVLAHENSEILRKVALFDAVINNGDRKAGHLLRSDRGDIYAIDHGVTFHPENKLRTVLWGWLDATIDPEMRSELKQLRDVLAESHADVDQWLTREESDALRVRLDRLIDTERFPVPSAQWPAVPWPVF